MALCRQMQLPSKCRTSWLWVHIGSKVTREACLEGKASVQYCCNETVCILFQIEQLRLKATGYQIQQTAQML